ncbi:MAG: hypothetical protein PVF55_08565 [Desulfobacterales bacterium]
MRLKRFGGCFRYPLSIAAVSVMLLLSASQTPAAEEGTFTGTWIVSGQRQMQDFLPGRDVFTFRLQGHVNLKNNLGEVSDFWSECAGIWDDRTGSEGRCVWRSLEGAQAFIVLRGRLMEENIQVVAEVVGGTGRLKDVQGSFKFTWSSVFIDPNTQNLTAHSEAIAGQYRIP